MRLSPISNNNYRYNTSFGMAKLTQKGLEAAQGFVSDIPQFVDTTCYKKNLMTKMLKSITKKGEQVDFAEFFKAGTTVYPSNNRLFIQKQVTSGSPFRAIRKFLDKSINKGGDATQANALVGELLNLFDYNIANKEVSSAQGRKIIDLVKPYITTEQLSPRIAVVSDKIFTIN